MVGVSVAGQARSPWLRSRLRRRLLPDQPRDIESSVGFPTMARSVGFPTMDLAFSVGVSRTGI